MEHGNSQEHQCEDETPLTGLTEAAAGYLGTGCSQDARRE